MGTANTLEILRPPGFFMETKTRTSGEYTILEIDGDVDLYNVGELKKTIFNMVDEEDITKLVLDMQGINYMDSSGVGALVAGHKKLKGVDGTFVLLNIKEDILNILRLATLDQFFTICDSEDNLP